MSGLAHRIKDGAVTNGLLVRALLLATAALVPGVTCADVSDSHQVRVSVLPFSTVAIRGGDVPLSLAPREGHAQATTDALGLGLFWMTNQQGQKITAVSSVSSPRLTLTVEAVNVQGGVATGAVPLGGATQDLVIGLSRGIGSCDLKYAAEASGLPQPSVDVHIVTYTIADG